MARRETAPNRRAMRKRHQLSLSIQYPDPSLKEELPRPSIRRWVQAALLCPAELTIRFVDAKEGRELNRDYRGKDYPTNVLTFAYSQDASQEQDTGPAQADIILCTEVLQREAQEKNISLTAHAAHLVVHGVLHAQGYDHELSKDAQIMEQLEIEVLGKLGFSNPYA